VQRAKELVLAFPGLSARDSVHIAVMEAHRIRRILSFDAGFDEYAGIERVRL
jgi:hypothetical protein